MKPYIEPAAVLAIVKVLGLETNHKTGGQQFDNIDFDAVVMSSTHSVLSQENGDPIRIFSGRDFFETVQHTEKTLNIRLFT